MNEEIKKLEELVRNLESRIIVLEARQYQHCYQPHYPAYPQQPYYPYNPITNPPFYNNPQVACQTQPQTQFPKTYNC